MSTTPHMPRHPLDPVAAQIVAAVQLDDNWVNMTRRPAAAMRAAKNAGIANMPVGPQVARVEDFTIPARDGADLPMRLYCATNAPEAVLLWIHGGGFTLGDIASFDTFCRHLALRANAVILCLEYRLAPEHAYPIPLHDTIDALRWCLSDDAHERTGALPLIVGGDSAGGNLATVAIRALRSEARVAGQILAYPCTDDSSAESIRRFDSPFLGVREIEWFYDQYHPAGSARLDPDVSPLHASDLSGMPPTLIVTAEHDVLTEQGEAYGCRLRDADTPVTILRYSGLIHGFLSLDPFYSRQGGDAMTIMGAFAHCVAKGQAYTPDAPLAGVEIVD